MASIFDNFFDTGETTSTTQKLDVWNDEQKGLFSNLTNLAKQQQPVYSGNLYAEQNPYESNFFNYVAGVPQALNSSTASLQQAYNPAYNTSPEATQAYWNQTLLPQFQKTFTETTLPQFREQFSGPQWWSQNRANQTTDLFNNYNQQLMAKQGELIYNDELARRQALEAAMGRRVQGAPIEANNQVTGANILGTAGNLGRTIDQEKVSGQLQKWLMGGKDPSGQTNAVANPNVSLAMSLLGISPFAYQTTQTTKPSGLGAGILTGMAGGLGAASTPGVTNALSSILGTIGSGASTLWDNIPWDSLFNYDIGSIGGNY